MIYMVPHQTGSNERILAPADITITGGLILAAAEDTSRLALREDKDRTSLLNFGSCPEGGEANVLQDLAALPVTTSTCDDIRPQ